MAGEAEGGFYDAGVLINSLEEKIESLKEKVNLLARSLVELKDDFEKRLEKKEKEIVNIKFDLENTKRKAEAIFEETAKFVKRDDLILIERMLKDFQPLEFVRKKDIEEILEKNKNTKNE